MNAPFDERVTQYYAALARSRDPACDPIAAQFVPQTGETLLDAAETDDPLQDRGYAPVDRLVHRYPDRALILATDRCAVYCRHCFRRHFTERGSGAITEEQLNAIVAYLARQPQVTELLLSGGDPLMLEPDRLESVLERLYSVNPAYIVRVCTRVPVVMPSRIGERLAAALGLRGGLWLVTQVNHPHELTPEFAAALRRLQRHGVPVLNQSVLLRGVNDSLETLVALFRGLLQLRVKPYYLFQADLAAGTRHLRVSIEEGLELMRKLRTRVSGPALPVYALDQPGAGGKLNLEIAFQGVEGESYLLRDGEGREYRYPRELPSAAYLASIS